MGNNAARYLIAHMQLPGGEEDLLHMMYGIFSLKDNALANWVRLDDPDEC